VHCVTLADTAPVKSGTLCERYALSHCSVEVMAAAQRQLPLLTADTGVQQSSFGELTASCNFQH
jgi:hypothetical protein